VLLNSSPRYVRGPELPWLPTRADEERRAEEMVRRWGDPALLDDRFRQANPSATDDERRALARVFRLSVSPGSVAAYMRMNMDMDVCGILPLVRVPTLVLHRRDVGPPIASGRYIADRIPGAQFVELPGADFGVIFGETDRVVEELEAFLSHLPAAEAVGREPDRVLTTVLFTDIVGSTAKAAEVGDAAWRELLHRHHDLIRRQLTRHRGRELDTAGDGFFASFDGPARAIHCAWTIREAVPDLGLEVRAGLHTGECELVDGKVGGIAVHIGARVARQAGPGEVLVSQTVKDLVAGSGIAFSERGAAELKGVPGEWRLFAVEQV
jgi:class 3 adenylate cyclase